MRSAPHSRPRAAMSQRRSIVSGCSGDAFRGRDQASELRGIQCTVIFCQGQLARKHRGSQVSECMMFAFSRPACDRHNRAGCGELRTRTGLPCWLPGPSGRGHGGTWAARIDSTGCRILGRHSQADLSRSKEL